MLAFYFDCVKRKVKDGEYGSVIYLDGFMYTTL